MGQRLRHPTREDEQLMHKRRRGCHTARHHVPWKCRSNTNETAPIGTMPQTLRRVWGSRSPTNYRQERKAAHPAWKAAWQVLRKHTLFIQSRNHAAWYLPKWVKILCPCENLHTDVYSSFVFTTGKKQWRHPSGGEWINWSACRGWDGIQH